MPAEFNCRSNAPLAIQLTDATLSLFQSKIEDCVPGGRQAAINKLNSQKSKVHGVTNIETGECLGSASSLASGSILYDSLPNVCFTLEICFLFFLLLL